MRRNRTFALDRTDGKLAGVCSGLANYTGIEAIWIRVALVLLTIFGSFLTIPAYIATALLAPERSLFTLDDAEEDWMLRKMARTRSKRSGSYAMDRYTVSDPLRTASSSRLSSEIDSLR